MQPRSQRRVHGAGVDPCAYLRDVLARIHTHPKHRLEELPPHRWRPA